MPTILDELAHCCRSSSALRELRWRSTFLSICSAGIVYCLSCKDTEVLASQLSARGLPAAPYHAQMDPQLRPWMCTANGPGVGRPLSHRRSLQVAGRTIASAADRFPSRA